MAYKLSTGIQIMENIEWW